MSEFCSIENAIEAIRDGEIIVVVDDADRENEGDMILAAEKATPEKINFLARFATVVSSRSDFHQGSADSHH